MKVVIANFNKPRTASPLLAGERTKSEHTNYWISYKKPEKKPGLSLFEQPVDWGFHIYALGVYLRDLGIANDVEFWRYSDQPSTEFHPNGILRVLFTDLDEIAVYVERYGYPDLFVNYGRHGKPVLKLLEGKSFRVHIPCLRGDGDEQGNSGAECYLVDSEEYLDRRAMLYVPVVNIWKIYPLDSLKKRDFIYLAALYPDKNHELLINAVRGSRLSGHLHPVDGTKLDLSDTYITTSNWNEADIVELLRTSRIAVYCGEVTSNPAAMWECVAAGLPIVVNEKIRGGKHVVVPGITGELASPENFLSVMKQVLTERDRYRPREYFEKHWDTVSVLDQYLSFFQKMGFPLSET